MVMPGFPHAHKKPQVSYARWVLACPLIMALPEFPYYPFYRWKNQGTQRLAISQLESGLARTQPRPTLTTCNRSSVMSALKKGESLALAVPQFPHLRSWALVILSYCDSSGVVREGIRAKAPRNFHQEGALAWEEAGISTFWESPRQTGFGWRI